MKYIGMDGCKAGWVDIGFDDNGGWHIGVVSTIAEMSDAVRASEVTLIDIPIGLRERGQKERLCDLGARSVLSKRRASVFPTPCRPALRCTTYKEASATNYQHTGRKLSVQSWHIAAKIAEVDTLLEDKSLHGKLREMHPEIGFWAFNHKQELSFSKKTPEGLTQRQAILTRYCDTTEAIITTALKTYLRKDVARDDSVDALVLAVAATFANRLVCLPTTPEIDAKGLPMEIVYPDIKQ